MPRVAHDPGRGRSVRRACHVWHVRLARGRAKWRMYSRVARVARVAMPRVSFMPRVARLPGGGVVCHAWHMEQKLAKNHYYAAYVPRVAHAPGGRRSVRRTCHAWHNHNVSHRIVHHLHLATRRTCHAWQHMRQAGGGACEVRATRGTCARRAGGGACVVRATRGTNTTHSPPSTPRYACERASGQPGQLGPGCTDVNPGCATANREATGGTRGSMPAGRGCWSLPAPAWAHWDDSPG